MKQIKIWISVLLILVLLTGCGGNKSKGEWEVTAQPDAEFGTVETDEKDKNKDPNPSDEPSDEPTADDPSDEPSTDDPSEDDPVTDEPSTDEPVTDEPNTNNSSTDDPTPDEPTADDPTDTPADDTPKGTKVPMLSLNIRHAEQAAPSTRKQRVQRIGALLTDYRPAVVGLQEVRSWWMNDLEDSDAGIPDVMPEGYQEIHYYRDEKYVQAAGNGPASREGCAILYDTSVVTLLKEGRFWLSDRPEMETKFPDADCPRFAVWAKFKINATGEEFYFYTTHISTMADKEKLQELQIAQLEVLQEQVKVHAKQYGEAPFAICGDFNLFPDYVSYATIASELTDVGGELGDGGSTFPNWGANKWSDNARIDYFFINDAWTAVHYEVDQRVFDPDTGEAITLNFDPSKNEYGYYSDHAPVYIEVQFD